MSDHDSAIPRYRIDVVQIVRNLRQKPPRNSKPSNVQKIFYRLYHFDSDGQGNEAANILPHLPKLVEQDFKSSDFSTTPKLFELVGYASKYLQSLMNTAECFVMIRFIDGIARNFEKKYDLKILIKSRTLIEPVEWETIIISKPGSVPIAMLLEGTNLINSGPSTISRIDHSFLGVLLEDNCFVHLTKATLDNSNWKIVSNGNDKKVDVSSRGRSIAQSIHAFSCNSFLEPHKLSIVTEHVAKVWRLYGSLSFLPQYILGQVLSGNSGSIPIDSFLYKYDDPDIDRFVKTFVFSQRTSDPEHHKKDLSIIHIINDEARKEGPLSFRAIGTPSVQTTKFTIRASMYIYSNKARPVFDHKYGFIEGFIDTRNGNLLSTDTAAEKSILVRLMNTEDSRSLLTHLDFAGGMLRQVFPTVETQLIQKPSESLIENLIANLLKQLVTETKNCNIHLKTSKQLKSLLDGYLTLLFHARHLSKNQFEVKLSENAGFNLKLIDNGDHLKIVGANPIENGNGKERGKYWEIRLHSIIASGKSNDNVIFYTS